MLENPSQSKLARIKKLGNKTQKITLLKELLRENNNFVPAWVELGLTYRKQGDRQSAIDTFTQAVKIAPKNQKLILELATEQFSFNQLKNCRSNLEKLLEINSQNVPGLIKLGELERKQNNHSQALKLFKQALELNPKAIWATINYASELKHLGKLKLAKQKLEQALEYTPNNLQHSKILMELGYVERKLENPESALQWFTQAKATAFNPNAAVRAELCIAEQLRELGEIEQALKIIQPILKRSPKNIRAKIIYGTLLKRELKWQQAAELYPEVIDLAPQNIQAYLELATCLDKLGQTPKAIEILQQALSIDSANLLLLRKIASLYHKLEDRNQALEYYQQALDIDPKNLLINLDIAIAFKELGQIDQARQKLHQTLTYHPDNFQALMQMGRLEQKLQPKTALKYFDQAINFYPEKIYPHCAKVDLLFDAEDLTTAGKYLEQLVQKYPEEFQVYRYLGIHARKLGQRAKAKKWFEQALSKASNPDQTIDGELLIIEEMRDLGNFELTLELTEKIIKQYPEQIRTRMIRGSIFQKIPNLKAAKQVYKEILAINSHNLDARMELAKVYSQLGQVKQAISLLEKNRELANNHLQSSIQLGSLNQAMENWFEAETWYREVCYYHPLNPQGYCLLANLLSLLGKTETALEILQIANKKIHNSVQILLKSVELYMRQGKLDESYLLLTEGLTSFPHNIQLQWQLCQYHMQQGEYDQALNTLETITTDNQDWLKRTEELKANIYFYQYNYHQAEIHFHKAIALSPISTATRGRLATILMLTGRINEARQQFQLATKELSLKASPGKMAIPLRSHPAMVTNELRINPRLLIKLQLAEKISGYDRILELGNLLTLDPNYLGTALYLARDLRQQGIFTNIEQTLAQDPSHHPTIPKRIIQFWDEPEPPAEIVQVCQSWLDCNPDYEYIRFSLDTAIAFLQDHYDWQVLKAFENCDQPATQADFFRLAYLNKMGGFYADADDLCRKSLDWIVDLHPELVLLQEDFACIGNNFIGCIPGQIMIRTAFYQAVQNLAHYCNESPWFKTGPGLITSVVCSTLTPYLTDRDYKIWPRLLILSQAQLRKQINQHLDLGYKKTGKSWQDHVYSRLVTIT